VWGADHDDHDHHGRPEHDHDDQQRVYGVSVEVLRNDLDEDGRLQRAELYVSEIAGGPGPADGYFLLLAVPVRVREPVVPGVPRWHLQQLRSNGRLGREPLRRLGRSDRWPVSLRDRPGMRPVRNVAVPVPGDRRPVQREAQRADVLDQLRRYDHHHTRTDHHARADHHARTDHHTGTDHHAGTDHDHHDHHNYSGPNDYDGGSNDYVGGPTDLDDRDPSSPEYFDEFPSALWHAATLGRPHREHDRHAARQRER